MHKKCRQICSDTLINSQQFTAIRIWAYKGAQDDLRPVPSSGPFEGMEDCQAAVWPIQRLLEIRIVSF
jgi:hypothetical protein